MSGAKLVYISIPDAGGKNVAFYEKFETAMGGLFEAARLRNELHFALSLMSEFRGMRDAGWSAAEDAERAMSDYLEFLTDGPASRLMIRMALGLYCHLAEASGFYEIPKNLLGVAEGKGHSITPFHNLVEQHKATGIQIAPNANKVIRDLVGHAHSTGHVQLAEIFRDAFDPDIRNAYSHADYVVWNDGIRINLRLGLPKLISYADFAASFERGVNFFHLLHQFVAHHITSYAPPKKVMGALADGHVREWTIEYDADKRSFGVSG